MPSIKKITLLTLGGAALVLGGAGVANAGADADGAAVGSPGVLSGNLVQVPVHVPVNVCGNNVSVIGALNPAFGNFCGNFDDGKAPHHGAPGMTPGHGGWHHGH